MGSSDCPSSSNKKRNAQSRQTLHLIPCWNRNSGALACFPVVSIFLFCHAPVPDDNTPPNKHERAFVRLYECVSIALGPLSHAFQDHGQRQARSTWAAGRVMKWPSATVTSLLISIQCKRIAGISTRWVMKKVSKAINCHAESTQQALRIHHVFTSTPLNKTLNWNLHIIYISTTTTTLATSHFHFHALWFKNKSFSGTINYEFVSCLSAQYQAWTNSLLTHQPFFLLKHAQYI